MAFFSDEKYATLVDTGKKVVNGGLKPLLQDDKRTKDLVITGPDEGTLYDMSRQFINGETLKLLEQYCEKRGLRGKIEGMFTGAEMNPTEKRSVLHVALRATASSQVASGNPDIVKEVIKERERIKKFSEDIADGTIKGSTGKLLRNIVYVGIGGSYLGPEAIYEALRWHPSCAKRSSEYKLRFLANVDPVDFARAVDGLDPESTVVMVASKTFTTSETMRNASLARDWVSKGVSDVQAHLVAISTNLEKTRAFGIKDDRVFPFWDWVGGRYSVTSAIGLVPLSAVFGWSPIEQFLGGCRAGDDHYRHTPFTKNIPMLMGALGFYNSSVLGCRNVAVLPYAQPLHRFAAHLQQLTMESNGKRVDISGHPLEEGHTGEVYFGEPGTNSQHSFFQLLHQGLVSVNCEFIGFAKSQQPAKPPGAEMSCHDELMANFFAQPDALAYGKSQDVLKAANTPESLIPHKTFDGNRPSTILICKECSPHYVGQLLSFYEHRTATHGWLLGINSFDQFGVELGKELAINAGYTISSIRKGQFTQAQTNIPKHTADVVQAYCKMGDCH